MTNTQTYDGPERRQAERMASELAITVREAGRHQLPATLTSLSTGGCSIAGVTLAGTEGAVWVRIPGLESLPAQRCWNTIGAAGLAFEHALHPAVADRLTGQAEPAPVLQIVPEIALPRSRREQILQGHAELPEHMTARKRPTEGKATLGAMVRRRTTRVADHRTETRFTPPSTAMLGFRVAGEPARIHDLSPSGLQVSAELEQSIGAPVEVAFAGYPAMAGSVVWVRPGATGIRLADNALDLFEAA